MVGTDYLIGLVIASILIILLPGPSVMFVIARSIAWGRWTGWLTAVGNSLGMFSLAVVIALGLGPLLQHSQTLLYVVQALGGLYLIYLGIDALRHRRDHVAALLHVEEERPGPARILREGFTVGVLNPKGLVFFAAIFPQFVDPNGGPITAQLLLFGAIFAVLSILLDGTWAIIVGTGRDWFANSDSRLLVLRTIGGVVMIGLGIAVLIPVVDGAFFPA